MKRRRSLLAITFAIGALLIFVIGLVLYKTNSALFWTGYKDPEGRFSFRYPSNWYYEPKGYTIPGTWIPVVVGLYPLPKEKLESALKNLDTVNLYWLTFYNIKMPDFMPGDFEVAATKHTFLGKTDVITNKYCLKEGTLGKGNIPAKVNSICESHSLIDVGSNGVIEVSSAQIENVAGNNAEVTIYKKILSTLKFTK